MTTLTLSQAKRDFSIGYLKSFRLERRPMGRNWAVYLIAEGNGSGFLVDARRAEVREFSTLDAAVNVIEEIGFQVNALFRDGR